MAIAFFRRHLRPVFKSLVFALAACLVSGAANAATATITGPPLTTSGTGFTVAGLEFTAFRPAALTGFTFASNGAADTVRLISYDGFVYTVAQTVDTPAQASDLPVSVNWALTPGLNYFLVQSVASNTRFANFGGVLPATGDIGIVQSGVLGRRGLAQALTLNFGNMYWAAFTSLTTTSADAVSGAPEPASWLMLLTGFGLAGLAFRRRAPRFQPIG